MATTKRTDEVELSTPGLDAQGRPTGMLIDNAMNLVAELVGAPSREGRTRALRQGNDVYAGYGQALTDETWYDHVARVEFRRTF